MTTATARRTIQLTGATPPTHHRLAQLADDDRPSNPRGSLEVRLLAGLQFRDVETTTEGGYTVLRGLAVPWSAWASIGFYLESFSRGSLAKSIAEAKNPLPLNLFHDNRSFPIGAATSWKDDAAGLIGEWEIDQRDDAQEAARHADEKRLTGLSIEFVPIRSAWEIVDDWNPDLGPDYMDRCTRTEARLTAVGLVQSPAYVQAGVELVRAANARRGGAAGEPVEDRGTPALDAWRLEFEQLRRK